MANGVFSMVGNGIESGIGTYVTHTSAALSSALVPVVTTALTVWVMAYGFAVMRGEASESVPAFGWRAAKVAILLAIALGSGIYQSTVVTDVENGTGMLAQSIAQAGGGTCSANISGVTGTSSTSASSVYAALDCYDAQLGAVITADVNHASQSGLSDFGAAMGYLASAIIVAFGGSVFLLVGCLETVLARVFLDLVLGIGPLFIACGAFEPSRRFFDAWTGKVVTYCLMQVLIAAFLGIALAVFSSETASLTGLASLPAASDSGNLYTTLVNQMMGSSSTVSDDQYFVDALGMLVTGIFLAMLCWQLPSVASALGGGSAVTGVGAFAAGLASRAVAGAAGSALGKLVSGKGPGSGGSISPGGKGGSGGPGGPGNGTRPAYQRAVMDNLTRTSADRASMA
ncbi:conjugal transfer protein TraH [Pandoraea cepalis]|uniref:Conjugal transfer protein TraH n=1 Tax=Pandoraea cepalis TaxID=2508294 RepID=A0AAW7MGJ0_9BURK|nr:MULTISPECIES: type IV secretion system protein [Burkholderiaceae]MDN4571820.1 conjugal transfer protein TraH [Pandoraea cepalis]MDN4576836.1 conjugal transfer protein TraH [Pandoraea cepalis]